MKDRTVKRVDLQGPFAGEDLGAGRWRLSRTRPAPIEVFLRVADGTAAEMLAEPGIVGLDLDWRASGVSVAVRGRRGVQRVEADSVIVHEPRNELYQALPLAGFDAEARRFWSRVFTLMRIPGGRLLLRIIARRRR